MLPFAVGFLIAFTLRAELPAAGRLVAAATALAAILARVGRPKASTTPPSVIAFVAGAAVAALLPAPRSPGPAAAPVSLDARSMAARVEGVVQAGGRLDARGAWFRLRDGPHVQVPGARSLPPPGAAIAVEGRLDASRRVVIGASPAALSLVAPAPALSPQGFFESLRAACRERIEAACPPATARVLLPLLIGDAGLPESFREDLARTGTLHIVAVSGTHLSLFLAGLRLFTRRLRVLLPMLVLYAGMCAFEPPVLRSLVLAVGFLCGQRLGRALPQGAHFLFAACIVLAFDPDAFFDAGFQLSFSAFGGIVALAGARWPDDPFRAARLMRPWGRLASVLGPATRAGGGATLATAPAMIWRFNRVSPIGVPATILLAPFIPVLLWLGALIVIFPGAPAFPRLATAIVEVLVRVSSAIAAIPIASVDVPRPHAAAVAVFAGVIALVALTGGWSPRKAASVAVAALGVAVPDREPPGIYQLVAGRGSATLLLSGSAAALVDAGPRTARVAEQVLKLGVKTLDLVVITHDHADHAGGLEQVLSRLNARRIAVGPTFESPGAPVETWLRDSGLAAPGLELRAAWPPAAFDGAPNDRSLVLEARIEGLHALLCGDVESAGLSALLAEDRLGPVDVLLLPHHGSANDALGELLLVSRPRASILPARAGAPSEETLALLAVVPTEVRATYLEGMVGIPSKPRVERAQVGFGVGLKDPGKGGR